MATAVKQTKRKPTGAAAKGAGPGRPKGSTNKVPAEVKAMVREALERAGGVTYLVDCAHDPKTKTAFLLLVGKILPLMVSGDQNGPLQIVISPTDAKL